MKILKFILLLLLLVTNNSFAQLYKTYNTKETDPVNLEREKKIRSKNNISESFEFFHQINSNDSILKSHKTYNKNGEILTNIVFSLEQDTLNNVTYEYEDEKLVKSNLYFKNKKNIVFNSTRIYSYDKNGNNSEIQIINKDGKIIYQTIDYNSNNLKKALNSKWLNKTDFSITEEYFYSKNNNLIKKKIYNPNGELFCEVKYQYDNLGNLIGSYRLQNGKKDIIDFYLYDKDNNLIESGFEFFFDKKPNQYKTKYEYDTNHNIIKEYHIEDNIVKSIHSIKYKKFE